VQNSLRYWKAIVRARSFTWIFIAEICARGVPLFSVLSGAGKAGRWAGGAGGRAARVGGRRGWAGGRAGGAGRGGGRGGGGDLRVNLFHELDDD
jgi:hypothetical protein